MPEIPGLPAGVKIGGTEFRFDTLSFASLFIRMVISFCAVTLFGLNGLPCLMRFVRSHLKVREIYFCIFIGIILLVSYLRRRVAYTAP